MGDVGRLPILVLKEGYLDWRQYCYITHSDRPPISYSLRMSILNFVTFHLQ